MRAQVKPPTICLLAGDVSGDRHAGHLAAAIRQLAPGVRLVGAGGQAMRDAGVEVPVQITDLSVVGALDALRVAGKLRRRFGAVRRVIIGAEPDLVVLVDTETLLSGIARWLRRRDIPLILFFPPQVWLWGRWRLRSVAPLARRVISAFASEADLYRAAGVDTVWIGHPLAETVQVAGDPAAALREVGLDPARPVVGLMPGSRRREFRALLTPILGAARALQVRDPALQFVLPLASETFRSNVEQSVERSGVRDLVISGPQFYTILSCARAVVQCSGTATLETALLGIPSVIVYRCHPLEYLVARYLYSHVEFIGLPNILLGEMVQPEFFQKHADAEHLAAEAWSLLTDESRRGAIQARLAELRRMLGPCGAFSRAARAVVELLPASAVRPVET